MSVTVAADCKRARLVENNRTDFEGFSSASPPLMRIPFSAPFPVPTITAVGSSSPIAHGHAITITDVNTINAVANRAKGSKLVSVKYQRKMQTIQLRRLAARNNY